MWDEASPSAMERHEFLLQELMRGKIMRWQGKFDEAVR